jgi:hypothetical protein
MERGTFAERLHAASVVARDFAGSFVTETLPEKMLFRVRLNQSYDGNPLHHDERLYPEGSGVNLTERYSCCTESEVVDLLWRDNQVPEWIDIAVVATKGSATILGLTCCGRFTGNEELLYHRKGGWPPFQPIGPVLPPGYRSGQRFSIYHCCEALKLADAEALQPHSDKVRFLDLRGTAWDDLTLSSLPKFSALEVLDLTHTGVAGYGLAGLYVQPKLGVLKILASQAQPLDLQSLPRLPLLKTLLVDNPPSVAFDFGNELPKLPILNWLDLRTSGVMTLDGRLPDSMSSISLVGRAFAGALTCSRNVEHLSLSFPEVNEGRIANFVRQTRDVKFLNLTRSPVSDAFVRDLLDRWPLEYLKVSGTRVTEELVKQLIQLRPKLRVFHESTRQATL